MRQPSDRPSAPPEAPPAADTQVLVDRIRAGDEAALGVLIERYLPVIRRWARGRLPLRARSLADTDDLVQEVMLQAIRHLARLDYRGEQALEAYLRRSIANRIRSELRRARRRIPGDGPADDARAEGSSPLEEAEAHELLERYRRAFRGLRAREQDLLVGRLELGCSFRELASTLHLASDEAARKAFTRAVDQLANGMGPAAPERRG